MCFVWGDMRLQKKRSRVNVFIGVNNICGIPAKMSRAFDSLGIKSKVYCIEDNKQYKKNKNDELLFRLLFSIHEIVKRIYITKQVNRMILRLVQLVETCLILLVFLYSLMHYTHYVYVYAAGLFSVNPFLRRCEWLEFAALYRLKKKVVILCCGSDSRPPYCGKFNGTLSELKRKTEEISRRVHMMEKYCKIIDNPASSQFHNKPFINYTCVGNLMETEEIKPFRKQNKHNTNNNRVRVIHAPSNTSSKGTNIIRKIVEELKDEMYPIEYVEVSGVTHDELLSKLYTCDILVNELYSDFPMSMIDAEAALLGVTSITCGYYASYYKDDLKVLLPPSILCLPEQLKTNLKKLILDDDYRNSQSTRCKEFVEKNWMSEVVVQNVMRILNDDYPSLWEFDPQESRYIWGASVSKQEVEERVNALISKYGVKALCLTNKKELEHMYNQVWCNRRLHNE